MSRNRLPSDHTQDKAGGSGAETEAPMERFKSLTRRLLSVSNAKLQEERRRNERKTRRSK